MNEDPRLDDLLDRWEELRDQGKELTAEELSAGSPHLLEVVRQRLRVLKASDWLSKPLEELEKPNTVTAHTTVDSSGQESNAGPPEQLGDYSLLEKIGAGGMGQVYKAVHRRMDRTVALKVLPEEAVASPHAVQRFEREVKAAAKLVHPNIVTAYDAGEQDGIHFLVMEFVAGIDLHAQVQRHGPLAVEQAVRFVRQAARGLQYAHEQGVIHRDIKPGNLLLASDGTVKILDMGLARLQASSDQDHEAPLTQAGAVMGTPDYLAPEQSLDAATADHRADIYSLGCTLHYLLTGKPMYEGGSITKKIVAHREAPIPSLRQVRADVPQEVDAVFRRMVAKKPTDRLQSMAEVLAALASESAVPAPRPRRRKWFWAAGLAAAVLVGAGAVLLPGFIVRVPVKGVGTVVLKIDQPGTEVLIDGKKITIQSAKGEAPITIETAEGKHQLKVTKAGFETHTQEFRVKSGDNEAIHVYLEPSKGAASGTAKTTEKVGPKGLPADLSKNLGGTWSGSWEDADGDKGDALLSLNDQPDGSITGWLDKDYKIHEGRRVSPGEVAWTCSNAGESFQMRGKIRDRGRTLLLLYAGRAFKKGKFTSVVGVERLTRDGAGPYSDPKPAGWSGKWIGKFANSQGVVGDETLVLKESPDGKLVATGSDSSTMTIERVNDHLLRWQQVQPEYEDRVYRAEARLEGDTLRTTYRITYPPGSAKEGFAGAEWFIRD